LDLINTYFIGEAQSANLQLLAGLTPLAGISQHMTELILKYQYFLFC